MKEKKESKIKNFFKKIAVWLGLGSGLVAIGVADNVVREKLEESDKAIEDDDASLKEKENKITQNKQQNDFLNNIKVENTRDEIDKLKTKDDVLRYIKNMYIEEYEKITGDDTLTTEDIKIIYGSQNYEYVLDDGTIVSHGQLPKETEEAIKSSGNSIKSTNENVKYYTVYKFKDNGKSEDYDNSLGQELEIIDCIKDDIFIDVNATQVIPGDKYAEMKDGYPSVLKNFGAIVERSFSLMNVMENSEGKEDYIDVKKDELAELIDEYKSNSNLTKRENIQATNQNEKIEENETELEN